MALLSVDDREIRGDFIVSMVERTDLTPVPASLEIVMRHDEDLLTLMAEGKVITVASENGGGADYRIIKSVPANNAEGQQDGRLLSSIAISAYLDKTAPIGFRRSAAIIKEDTSLAQIYSAAGATLSVENDLNIPRFACLVGQVPSFAVAKVLQEEGGVVLWTGRALRFVRLAELVAQEPITQLTGDQVTTIESGFLERHQVPWFYSVDADGSILQGNAVRARAADYSPRKTVGQLRSATRCLILRHKLTSLYRRDINAGASIKVGNSNCPIITAAHVYESGVDGSPSGSYSKFWLGEVDE